MEKTQAFAAEPWIWSFPFFEVSCKPQGLTSRDISFLRVCVREMT